ncbi:MAG TPA: PfkB family carbohydrate kinase [Nitrososphaeraceae archaeon]|jgi:sugar/nucleoside kinase (ribokinase family)|nr:PfkB family carbohydrate kinase [Nitrososphaeraceae archaeon]
MLTIFGTVALDTTRTPFHTIEKALGGTATFSSISASNYTATSLIGIVGHDFPPAYLQLLKDRLDIRGLSVSQTEKTFHYDSSFGYDLAKRTTNKTELNVIANYQSTVPEEYIDSEFVYLANNDPIQNMNLLKQFSGPKLVVCDTMDFWISNKREDVMKLINKVDGIMLNESEAKLLVKENNILKCARLLVSNGPSFAVINKGENGSLLFHDNQFYPLPAFPTEVIKDPTGAGDSFGGAFIGYLSLQQSHDSKAMKNAMIHGNIMGSFTIEDYGVQRLVSVTLQDIKQRHQEYKEILTF